MNWSVSYLESERIVYIQTSGILDAESGKQMRHDGFKMLNDRQCTRCLLDHRELEAEKVGITKMYNLPAIYEQEQIPRTIHLALLVHPRHYESLRFYETVCLNNGYQARIFTDYEEAIDWLKN